MRMSPSQPAPPGRAEPVVQAALVAACFSLLLAGSNAFYPLLPVYRDRLGLDPLVLSLTFTLYVAALVVVLFTLARPRFTRHAAPLLLASLTMMLTSDLLLAHASESSTILLGRAVAGIAGGLGTGAASALVVAAIGDRGRAVTATGNLAGAVLGAGGAQLLIGRLPAQSPQTVFLSHAVVVGALLIAVSVVLWMRREVNRSALSAVPGAVVSAHIDRPALRMFATGTIAWTSLSVAVVFGATVFDEFHRSLVRDVGPVVLLCASAVAQLSSPTIARFSPWVSGVLVITAGVIGILSGAWLRADPPAIVGFVLLGAGAGIAYRAALVALTRGATPARQGALASLYAGITYTIAASVVLMIGWIGNTTGLVPATVATLAVLGVLAAIAPAWTPRLRNTINNGRPHTHPHQLETVGAADHV